MEIMGVSTLAHIRQIPRNPLKGANVQGRAGDLSPDHILPSVLDVNGEKLFPFATSP